MRGRAAAVRAALVAALVVGALAGCTSNPVAAAPTATPTPVRSTPAPIPTPTTPPPTQDADDATPVRFRCAKLAPAALVAQLAPDLEPVRGWMPEADSPSARLEALHGTTCAWRSSAGDQLEVSVARPSAKDATALKNDLVGRAVSVPTYGREAYFQQVDRTGEVDAFRGRTWILARSNRFYEPGDASSVIASVDSALAGPTPSPSPSSTLTSDPAPTATTN